MQIISRPAVEARAWLRGNPNPNAFAGNRFDSTECALAFVDALYAEGATLVLVDEPEVNSDGTPYADTLLVRFGAPSSCWRLQRFCEQEGPGDVPEGDFTIHVFESEIRLWWD
jgi:hypothetical protein